MLPLLPYPFEGVRRRMEGSPSKGLRLRVFQELGEMNIGHMAPFMGPLAILLAEKKLYLL
jgi:hypothetical protein